jgi:chromosomal replication initiator protein
MKDPKEIWRTTLAQIEIKLDSPAQYKTFFQGASLVDIKKDTAIISVPNPYALDWLKQRHTPLIAETISYVYGQDLKLEFVVQSSEIPQAAQPTQNDLTLLNSYHGVASTVSSAISSSGLNPKYTFNNYIVGDTNRIAHAAAAAVIENPGTAYNPLFIYGKTGVGKTHLAQAIGRSVLERNPNKKVVYTSSESFLNDMVNGIRKNKMNEFRAKYRQVNVLIIDDIQLISKWVSTQGEFFNTFNELHNSNSQIVLIADRRPEEIKDLEDRLRSRFQGGMVADIHDPDYELRLAILEKKNNDSGLGLNHRLLEIIAREIKDNIRELEGALQKVALFNQMKPNGELTTDEVAKIVGSDHQTKREQVKVPAILKSVGKSFAVTVKDLKGPKRTKEIALARQVCMYLLRSEFGYKLDDIANFLSRSDHTTVMHAVDKIESMMLTTEGFKDQIVSIIKELTENRVQD